jgi:aspartyl-tRNA(Asn)/glutamyl-tRNA(Gln) amidotransferase subunit C
MDNQNSQKTKKDLSPAEVRKIADLANIHIDDSELEKYGKWISDILEYVDQLGEVDTSKFEFKSQSQLQNVMRLDKVVKSLTQEQAVSGRKDSAKNGYFTIKSVFTPSE